jgi:membrane protein YqaA with SNARE-associated domain
MRRSWEWFQKKATTAHARVWLALLAFSESSFFLVPPDVLLIAMLAARSGRWVQLALITSVASLVGAVAGYLVGAFVFEPLAQPIVDLYHLSDEFAHVGDLYTKSVFWAVLLAAFTPIPYKVFVLAGGFFLVPFVPFLLASAIGRSARFFLIAALAHRYGPAAAELFIQNFKYFTIIALIILSIGLAVYFDLPMLIF